MRNTIALALVLGFGGCTIDGGGGGGGGGNTPDAGTTSDGGKPSDGCVGAGCQVGTCPTGMVWISPLLCIDATEATVNDFLVFINSLGSACTDPGPTCTACGGQRCFISNVDNPWHYDDSDDGWYIEGPVGMSLKHPARYVTFAAAKAACNAQGKHLCSADEWTDACRGASNLAYPYGSTYQAGRCNTASGFSGSPWAVGNKAECASASAPALVDMSGNVWEWTNDCGGDECTLRGGAFTVDGGFFPTALSCSGMQGHDQANETFGTDHDIGYRCCAYPKS